jgi:sRNA-binding protein
MRVGIHKDILAAGFPKAGLRLALRIYTGNGNYLFALRPGAPRVDLDGNVAGVVSEEAALVAAAELSRRKARNQARREPNIRSRSERRSRQKQQHRRSCRLLICARPRKHARKPPPDITRLLNNLVGRRPLRRRLPIWSVKL